MTEYTVLVASGREFYIWVVAGEPLELLVRHYVFTEEWLDYIINYDIKYRFGDELNAEE